MATVTRGKSAQEKHPARLREPSIWAEARSHSEIVKHGHNRAYPELHPAKRGEIHDGRKVIAHDSKEWMGRNTQPPQFVEDQHAKGYNPDVPLKGARSWLRGGEDGGLSRPTYDHMKRSHSGDLVHNPHVRRGEKIIASGRDAPQSPLSAANDTWIDPRSKDWG
jgi:hypothetical protein